MSTHYTLGASDVGKPWIRFAGRSWPVSGFIGQVLPGDVGKRVYLRGGVLQVENEAQRASRLRLATVGPYDLAACLRDTLRALESHLDGDTLHAGLKHRDLLCPCNQNEVARAREVLRQWDEGNHV